MVIDKAPYWDHLVDYYFEEVHWEEGYSGIYEWLEYEYGAKSSTTDIKLRFEDDRKAMWFKLRFDSETSNLTKA